MARIPKWGQQLKERIETGQGYMYGNEGKKATWRTDYLKDLPTKQYGRSYDDKLKTFVQQMGGDEKEANQFRTWMNQREAGELEKNKLDSIRRQNNEQWKVENKARKEKLTLLR